MRHIRVQQLFSSTHGAPDQIRSDQALPRCCDCRRVTGDHGTLDAARCTGYQGGKSGAGLGERDLHRIRRSAISDAEIPDSDARPGPHIADLGREDDAARRSPSIYAHRNPPTATQCPAW